VESATADNAVNRLWGEVGGVGKNKLGELLMEVRAELTATVAAAKTIRNVEPKAATKGLAEQSSTNVSDTPRSKKRKAADSFAA
jgi:hypothetical protein